MRQRKARDLQVRAQMATLFGHGDGRENVLLGQRVDPSSEAEDYKTKDNKDDGSRV